MPRVYAPVTADDVVELLSAAECAPRVVFGLTPRLRDLMPQEDEEGLEHMATQLAAAATASDPVTVAVFEVRADDVETGDAPPEAVPGSMHMIAPLRHRDLVCFLVADPGERVLDDAELELSWYDAGELPTVRDLLTMSGRG